MCVVTIMLLIAIINILHRANGIPVTGVCVCVCVCVVTIVLLIVIINILHRENGIPATVVYCNYYVVDCYGYLTWRRWHTSDRCVCYMLSVLCFLIVIAILHCANGIPVTGVYAICYNYYVVD